MLSIPEEANQEGERAMAVITVAIAAICVVQALQELVLSILQVSCDLICITFWRLENVKCLTKLLMGRAGV